MSSQSSDMIEHCTQCNEQLEIGQIGKCDDCQSDSKTTWENHYCCPCGEQWTDTHECCCNDRCPSCNKEIEPYISDDGSVDDDAIERALIILLASRNKS